MIVMLLLPHNDRPHVRVVFSLLDPLPRIFTLFPYTTLFRSDLEALTRRLAGATRERMLLGRQPLQGLGELPQQDRKSTRLNSSHRCISYAVFCLKKKKLK